MTEDGLAYVYFGIVALVVFFALGLVLAAMQAACDFCTWLANRRKNAS